MEPNDTTTKPPGPTGPAGPNTITGPDNSRPEYEVNSTKYKLSDPQYIHEEYPKDQIYIHFTSGTTVSGALAQWESTKSREGTAYIIDVFGGIFQVFPDKFWAGHLGLNPAEFPLLNPANALDKRSIGIELINVGPLKLRNNTLYWWPGDYTAAFCHVDEKDRYIVSKFRGIDYYAVMPDDQQHACAWLVKQLCAKYKVPTLVVPPNMRGQYKLQAMTKFRGILGHENVNSGKYDPGPAYNWDALEKYLSGAPWKP